MYAAVTTARIDPARLADYLALSDRILAHIEDFPGVQHVYDLTDRASGQVMSIVLYATAADAARTATSGDYQRILEQVGPMLLGAPERTVYEVTAHA